MYRSKSTFFLILTLFLFVTGNAMAASGPSPSAETVQLNLDFVWTLVAATLVLMMQGGFLMLEAGMVRSKNSINVAQKNLADLIIAGMVFGGFGFMLMFGQTIGGWVGWEQALLAFDDLPAWTFAFFVFQVTFCGTAATIVSGAVAERMSYMGYIIAALLISALIYPVFGHWAWGNLLNGDNAAFLADQGFLDFAGSTVVHSTGAWVALAAIIVLGPRIGRFDEQGNPIRFIGHNPVLAAFGAVVLLVGWFGFNGGSTTAGTGDIAKIISNTFIAAVGGGLIGMVVGRFLDYSIPAEYEYVDETGRYGQHYGFVNLHWEHGYFRPERMINGLLAGLVSITAGCDVMTAQDALLVGAIGALVATFGGEFLERICKLDDVVGAVSVHGFAGIWGTVAIAFFGDAESMVEGSRWMQFLVQTEGVVLNFVWAFSLSYLVFKLIDKTDMFGGLRVSPDDEELGLNFSEHNTRLGSGQVISALKAFADGDHNYVANKLDETAGDESGELGMQFNRIIGQVFNRVVDSNRELNEHCAELEGVSEKLYDNSNANRNAASAVAEASGEVLASVGDVRQAMAGIEESAQTAHAGTQSITSQAAQVSEHVAEISSGLGDVQNKASNARQITDAAINEADAANRSMNQLSEATGRISSVLQLVQNIASQTNLLALNATIEAARAGEAGKGFAVVATEVKNLAGQTEAAVSEINTMVEEIASGAKTSGEVMQRMSEVIRSMDGAMSEIIEAVGHQGDLTGRISTSVDGISVDIERVNEQIAAMVTKTQTAGSTCALAEDKTRKVTENIEGVVHNAESGRQLADTLIGSTKAIIGVAKSLDALMTGRAGNHGVPSLPAMAAQ